MLLVKAEWQTAHGWTAMSGSMMQAELETARADGQDLEAQLAAEVEAKSTLEKARAAAVQVRPGGRPCCCCSFATDQDLPAPRLAWWRLRPLRPVLCTILENCYSQCLVGASLDAAALAPAAQMHGPAPRCHLHPAPAGRSSRALKHGTNVAACRNQRPSVILH